MERSTQGTSAKRCWTPLCRARRRRPTQRAIQRAPDSRASFQRDECGQACLPRCQRGQTEYKFDGKNADVLRQAAKELGTSPEDLATVISYESKFRLAFTAARAALSG